MGTITEAKTILDMKFDLVFYSFQDSLHFTSF